MRIIAGKLKGRRLRTINDDSIRPTSDRLRETLFNILYTKVLDSTFLDLCTGSGAIGIEAFSRGAKQVTFVENKHKAVSVLIENLDHCKIEEGVLVLQRDAESAIKQILAQGLSYNFIFFDPPYNSDIYEPILEMIGNSNILSVEGYLIVEHFTKNFVPQTIGQLRCFREVHQGKSSLSFYTQI